jgi:hypothetical protein
MPSPVLAQPLFLNPLLDLRIRRRGAIKLKEAKCFTKRVAWWGSELLVFAAAADEFVGQSLAVLSRPVADLL